MSEAIVGVAEGVDDREDKVYGGGRLDSGSVSLGSGLSEGDGGVFDNFRDGPERVGKCNRRCGLTLAGDMTGDSSDAVVVVSLLGRPRDGAAC